MVKNNIDALRSVYLSLGGSLDDAYEDINGGSPVSAYRSVKDHIAAISKLDVGSSGGSGLPEVTAEDNGKILQVGGGEWSTSFAKINISSPSSSLANMLYLVSYESDSNQIQLTHISNRVYNFIRSPAAITNATISLVQQNVLNIVQSKKWHALETRITPDDETRNFVTDMYSPFVLYNGQTPINITYNGSTRRYFEAWEYADQINGFLHSYVNYEYESSNDEVVISVLIRYEESV